MTENKGLTGIGKWINIIAQLGKHARYSGFPESATTNGD